MVKRRTPAGKDEQGSTPPARTSRRAKPKASKTRLNEHGLTAKEEAFCHEYRACNRNATEAARRIGYRDNGNSTIRAYAHQLATNPNVQRRIAALDSAAWRQIQMGADEVLARMARVGRADLSRAFREDGTLMDPREWDEDTREAISEFQVMEAGLTVETADMRNAAGAPHPDDAAFAEGDERPPPADVRFVPMYKKRIKLHDKLKALDQLARHHNLYADEAKTMGAAVGQSVLDIIHGVQAQKHGAAGMIGQRAGKKA